MNIDYIEAVLQQLEKTGVITVIDSAGFKQYYCKAQEVTVREQKSLDIRQRIYELIEKNPGLHMSKIAELLSMRVSLAEYHLNYLEKNSEIFAIKEGEYFKRYYVKTSDVDSREKKMLTMLRKEIPLKIVLLLLKHPTLQHRDLLAKLDIGSSTLSYHLTAMVSSGILESRTFGEEKGYRLRDRKEIIRLLLKYEVDKVVDGLKGAFEDLTY